jgi:uncharacterized protein YjbJ (UPF0337 family)
MNSDSVEGELRQTLGSAQSAFGKATGDLELDLRGKATEFAGKVQSAYGQAKDAAVETIDGVDAFVCERPYVTAAIAAAAGLLLGFVLGLGRPKVIIIRPAPPPRG